MFFTRKTKKTKMLECAMCNSEVDKKYSFCPFCGATVIDKNKEIEDFGILGKSDIGNNFGDPLATQGLGITDKIIGSLVNNLMRNLEKQFKEMEKTEVKSFPNGIRIKIGGMPITQKRQTQKLLPKKSLSDDQIKKMSSLPRTIAKSAIKRLSDKVVYELNTPGLESAHDVFVSKLESGYEIKAIGNKKIYVNSIPINLPLHGFSISDNKLLVEFKTEE